MNETTITLEHIVHYAHRIHNQVLPPGITPKCRNIHGHSGKIVATFEGPLNEKTGMILDFYYIKEIFRYIDSLLDHKLLISHEDKELLEISKYLPKESITVLPIPVVSCEYLANYILKTINRYYIDTIIPEYKLDIPVFCIKVQFWETEKAYAEAILSDIDRDFYSMKMEKVINKIKNEIKK